jgi:hypothetical protein
MYPLFFNQKFPEKMQGDISIRFHYRNKQKKKRKLARRRG